jgi:S-adenosylmethionine:tRNA ribosyltransferase-isomerase
VAEPIALSARIEGRVDEGGMLEVLFFSPSDTPLALAIEALGRIPLPPYLHRAPEEVDRERYQTVFARVAGAVAAPTAGLHLSSALLDRIRTHGIEVSTITLHVGLGTFQPVTVADLDDHPMHAEWFEIPAETAAAIDRARARGAPVIAVGTTVVRALESAASAEGCVRAITGETRLLIQPGYRFRVVDQLFTNFHLPQSTLLALVAAFAGHERILDAYRAAIAARYRFFSYGDAMLIRKRAALEGAEALR